MLKKIEDTLNKRCLIGLSYFNAQGEQLKQNILAGRVINVDAELGITVELFTNDSVNQATSLDEPNSSSETKHKTAHFILPCDLSCWFNAPKGEFHTSQAGVKISNPDYLVTWDIYQTKAQENNDKAQSSTPKVQDGEQQWWQWHPRTQSPNVG